MTTKKKKIKRPIRPLCVQLSSQRCCGLSLSQPPWKCALPCPPDRFPHVKYLSSRRKCCHLLHGGVQSFACYPHSHTHTRHAYRPTSPLSRPLIGAFRKGWFLFKSYEPLDCTWKSIMWKGCKTQVHGLAIIAERAWSLFWWCFSLLYGRFP